MTLTPLNIAEDQAANVQIVRTSVKHGTPALASDAAALRKYVVTNLKALTTHVAALKPHAPRGGDTSASVDAVVEWIRDAVAKARARKADAFRGAPHVVIRTFKSDTYLQVVSDKANTGLAGTTGFFKIVAQPQPAQRPAQQVQDQPAPPAITPALAQRVQQIETLAAAADRLDADAVARLLQAFDAVLAEDALPEDTRRRLTTLRGRVRFRQVALAQQADLSRRVAQVQDADVLDAQSLAQHRNDLFQAAVGSLEPDNQIGRTFLEELATVVLPRLHEEVLDTVPLDQNDQPAVTRARQAFPERLRAAYDAIANQLEGAVLNSYRVDDGVRAQVSQLLFDAAMAVAQPALNEDLAGWVRTRQHERRQAQEQARRNAATRRNLNVRDLTQDTTLLHAAAESIGAWSTAEVGARIIAQSLAALQLAVGRNAAILVDLEGGDGLSVRAVAAPNPPEDAGTIAARIRQIAGQAFRWSGDEDDALALANDVLAGREIQVRNQLSVFLW